MKNIYQVYYYIIIKIDLYYMDNNYIKSDNMEQKLKKHIIKKKNLSS